VKFKIGDRVRIAPGLGNDNHSLFGIIVEIYTNRERPEIYANFHFANGVIVESTGYWLENELEFARNGVELFMETLR
jgi:hypothetical protein